MLGQIQRPARREQNEDGRGQSGAVAGARSRGQWLNAADRLMLVAHEGLRRFGHPGFQCQTHVWLDGRLDVAGFIEALAALRLAYPVVVSRIARDDRGRPYWRFEADRDVAFFEHDLAGGERGDVWAFAERMFETSMDLVRQDPIEFHLLHLPDGRDVLLMRFNHVLMDGKGPEFALSEMGRMFAEAGKYADAEGRRPASADLRHGTLIPSAETADATSDEMTAYLRRHSRRKRFSSAMQVIRAQIKLPTKAAMMTQGDNTIWVHKPFRILVREMDEARTKAAVERVRKLCGFANLAPALLASAFRAIREFSDKPIGRRTGFKTDVPLNLRAPGQIHPVFRNFMSFIQMSARPGELDDRDALTKSLNATMREQIRRGVDVGTVQMMSLIAPHEKLLTRHLVERIKSDPTSLAFGFLGPVLPGLETFCGQRVEWLYSLNTSNSPPGMVLQVNQFRGRMNLMLTYIDGKVPEALANQFAEFIMDDLV
ncbi:MAG TPA: hypothetical protein VNT79_11610 [Phycisphaerae bacterium]|nr:hypothetical protein [Phycisphaerae bacterium]